MSARWRPGSQAVGWQAAQSWAASVTVVSYSLAQVHLRRQAGRAPRNWHSPMVTSSSVSGVSWQSSGKTTPVRLASQPPTSQFMTARPRLCEAVFLVDRNPSLPQVLALILEGPKARAMSISLRDQQWLLHRSCRAVILGSGALTRGPCIQPRVTHPSSLLSWGIAPAEPQAGTQWGPPLQPPGPLLTWRRGDGALIFWWALPARTRRPRSRWFWWTYPQPSLECDLRSARGWGWAGRRLVEGSRRAAGAHATLVWLIAQFVISTHRTLWEQSPGCQAV